MAKKIYPDSDLKNADWAKRTPDRIEDIEANIKKKGATDMGKAAESQLANKKLTPEEEYWEQEMREKEEWSDRVAKSGKQVGTAVKPPALKKDGSLQDPNPQKDEKEALKKGKVTAANANPTVQVTADPPAPANQPTVQATLPSREKVAPVINVTVNYQESDSPQNITVNVPPNPAPNVTVNNPPVTVHNSPNIIVPETPVSIVNELKVPPSPAPIVNVPRQEAPVVHFNPRIDVAPAQVTIPPQPPINVNFNVPEEGSETVEFEHDPKGRIKRAKISPD